jgi:trimeric autotransporter adhesin
MNPLIQFKKATPLFVVPFVLAYFGLSPMARAVSPAPDGGYPGGNTAEGQQALLSLTSGIYNTGIGIFSLLSLTDGSFCTGVGAGALFANAAGENTAIGAGALFSNTSGSGNTADGAFALFSNTEGPFNTATGWHALFSNTTGDRNTALGSRALNANTTGLLNTGVGRSALLFNTTGSNNVGIGVDAIQDNTAGVNNVAIGNFALLNVLGNNNTGTGFQALGALAQVDGTGNENTANGVNALANNTDGGGNTAIGAYTLQFNTTSFNNTAIGANALGNSTGSVNTALGINAGLNLSTGDNNIYIGNLGVDGESNTIRIGGDTGAGSQTATYIAGITGTAVVGDAVVVDGNGQLGTVASASRFKKEIRPMDKTSEAILALKPVRFQYKSDSKGTPQFGLIAEEVAKVNPDLVVRDRNGEIYSVRYEAVNAMLLNEFLKEHRTVQEQGATIARQQKQIEALTVGLQRVSAQIELSKPTPQTVLNNH